MEFPLYWGLQKTGLPLIVVTCTDDTGTIRDLCLLIDTGSTNNIMFSFVYEHFQSELQSLAGSDPRGRPHHCRARL